MSAEIDTRRPDQSAPPPAAPSPEAQPEPPTQPQTPRKTKSLTIGAVCKQLEREFPDISISKIRYLEDQKLLQPRRTPGGYRLYAPEDVDRLRTILRLQRDEFLPLRVIRQELASGQPEGSGTSPPERGSTANSRKLRRTTLTSRGEGAMYRLSDVLDDTGAEPSLVQELVDFGVIKGEHRDGEVLYDDTEREIVRAVTELARFGVGGRNLRVFRTSADREAALLEQILAPLLRSRNPQRRREGVETLENLAALATHLKHLLLVRDLRKIVS
jgi:DNA-binding transcriptional MerR regulator